MINLIVAYDEQRGIGLSGSLPWRLADDMAFFKTRTNGCAVIMGRKTWDSIPPKFRPLPDRLNIVLTRSDQEFPGAIRVSGLEEAIAAGTGKEIFIIGGEQIYKMALEAGVVSRIYASEVVGTYNCDVFFPPLVGDWAKKSISAFPKFTIQEYTKV